MASPLRKELTVAATTSVGYSDELVLEDIGIGPPRSVLNIEVANGAAAAVNAFTIQLKDHPNGSWYDYIGGADFGTPSGNMIFASTTTPPSTGAGAHTHAHIRVNSAYAVRFGTSLASGTGTVTVRVSANGQ
jgi:hypothetical protein